MSSPFTHDEMVEFVQEEEKYEANIRLARRFLQSLCEEELICEEDGIHLMEILEDYIDKDALASIVNDPTVFHSWIDATIAYLDNEPSECRYGYECTRKNCGFLHSKGRKIDCRFDINCTRIDCYFVHPNGRKIDASGCCKQVRK